MLFIYRGFLWKNLAEDKKSILYFFDEKMKSDDQAVDQP
jgi:hypothetical protein